MYQAYITRIKNVRPHSNADRLQVGECFGNTTIVSITTEPDSLGIYFPTDGKLSTQYASANNLLRIKDSEGNNTGGYLDPDKRHISTLKLRGEKSDGLFMPLSSLSQFTPDLSKLKEGNTITTLNGHLICEKYIPQRNNPRNSNAQTNTKTSNKQNYKTDTISYPYFKEHSDTSQLAYNLNQFKEGNNCIITLKVHGTSQRTSYTIKEKKTILPYWIYKILTKLNIKLPTKQSYDYICGTRRVILKNYESGYYGNDSFRKTHHNKFINKLHKGETAYYEVAGYTNTNQTIMPICNNSKTKDKEFIKQYGKETKFTYGCNEGESEIYVYRMTMTNSDGYVIEYPWHLVKTRCEQMGIKYTPELDSFIFTTTNDLMDRVNVHSDGTDPIGKTHIREGCVVRIENKEKFTAYKHKNFNFKVLESIIKIDDVLDMEEEQLQDEEETK